MINFVDIGIWLVSGIYKIAALAFEIFLILADGTVLQSIDYSTIIESFYVIIGIIMLFVLAFSLLKGMINPDDQKNGASAIKTTIVKLVTSAMIIVALPSLFSFAYDLQASLIRDYNPIAKLFGYGSQGEDPLGTNEVNGLNREKRGAYQIVNAVYTAFFNVNPAHCNEIGVTSLDECQKEVIGGNYPLWAAIKDAEINGNFLIYRNFSKQVDKNEITFEFLLSLIAGLILIYVAVSYCFDMAFRLVKLAFYQIIAPIPVFLRVLPGKLGDTFNQWMKVTLTCYMEVYVRIFALYFCIYLCKAFLELEIFDNIANNSGFLVSLLTKAFVLMGILMFMKQAPKLISDVTGLDSGNMKLGIGAKFKEAMSPFAGVGQTMGALGRKSIAGVDAVRRGQKFQDGWNRIEGKGLISKYRRFKKDLLPFTAAQQDAKIKSQENINLRYEQNRQGNLYADKYVKKSKEYFDASGEALMEIDKRAFIAGEANGQYQEELLKTYDARKSAKDQRAYWEEQYTTAINRGEDGSYQRKMWEQYKKAYEIADANFKDTVNQDFAFRQKWEALSYVDDKNGGLSDVQFNKMDESRTVRPNASTTNNRSGYQATPNNMSQMIGNPPQHQTASSNNQPRIDMVDTSDIRPQTVNRTSTNTASTTPSDSMASQSAELQKLVDAYSKETTASIREEVLKDITNLNNEINRNMGIQHQETIESMRKELNDMTKAIRDNQPKVEVSVSQPSIEYPQPLKDRTAELEDMKREQEKLRFSNDTAAKTEIANAISRLEQVIKEEKDQHDAIIKRDLDAIVGKESEKIKEQINQQMEVFSQQPAQPRTETDSSTKKAFEDALAQQEQINKSLNDLANRLDNQDKKDN